MTQQRCLVPVAPPLMIVVGQGRRILAGAGGRPGEGGRWRSGMWSGQTNKTKRPTASTNLRNYSPACLLAVQLLGVICDSRLLTRLMVMDGSQRQ